MFSIAVIVIQPVFINDNSCEKKTMYQHNFIIVMIKLTNRKKYYNIKFIRIKFNMKLIYLCYI